MNLLIFYTSIQKLAVLSDDISFVSLEKELYE